MGKARHIRRNQSGAAVAEYALVLSILGAALTFGALALGTAITDSVEEPAACIASSTGPDCVEG
jgi:Flp pilus assembly pilin Flp